MFKLILLCSLFAHIIWAKPMPHHTELAPHVLIVTPQAQLSLETLIPGTPIIQHLTPFTRFVAPHEETIVYVPSGAAAVTPVQTYRYAEIVARSLLPASEGRQGPAGNGNVLLEQIQNNIIKPIQDGSQSVGSLIAGSSTAFAPGDISSIPAILQGAPSALGSAAAAAAAAAQSAGSSLTGSTSFAPGDITNIPAILQGAAANAPSALGSAAAAAAAAAQSAGSSLAGSTSFAPGDITNIPAILQGAAANAPSALGSAAAAAAAAAQSAGSSLTGSTSFAPGDITNIPAILQGAAANAPSALGSAAAAAAAAAQSAGSSLAGSTSFAPGDVPNIPAILQGAAANAPSALGSAAAAAAAAAQSAGSSLAGSTSLAPGDVPNIPAILQGAAANAPSALGSAAAAAAAAAQSAGSSLASPPSSSPPASQSSSISLFEPLPLPAPALSSSKIEQIEYDIPITPILANEPRHHYVIAPAVPHIVDVLHGPVLLAPAITNLKARSLEAIAGGDKEKPIIAIPMPEPIKPEALPLLIELAKEKELLKEIEEKEKKVEFKRFLEANALKDDLKKDDSLDLSLKEKIPLAEKQKIEKLDLEKTELELKSVPIVDDKEDEKPQSKVA